MIPEDVLRGRKADHIRIALSPDSQHPYNFWDDIRFIHNPIPEADLEEIDLEVEVLGRRLSAPVIIGCMTGGFEGGRRINEVLAEVASELGLGMCVGSQRAALEDSSLKGTFSVVADYDIPLRIANIGGPQLAMGKVGPEQARELVDMIDGHALAVHLNYAQEVVQPEGETRARGLMSVLRRLVEEADFPIIVKETGCGIDGVTAKKLSKMGVAAVDVGGAGGTSFTAIEAVRAREAGDDLKALVGESFADWGIPAPLSVYLSSRYLDTIASGGIRNGVDVARALALGAEAASMARAFLLRAVKGKEETLTFARSVVEELRAVVFLTGNSTLEDLDEDEIVVLGRTKEWFEAMDEEWW